MTAGPTWFEEKARAMGGEPILFIEGYEWTGFAWWQGGKFVFPQSTRFNWMFSEMWELRLFGEAGEWHCWKTGEGDWESRFRKASDWVDEKEIREYVLWGADSGNGAVWVPFEVRRDLKQEPLRLVSWLRVDYDESSGQAYVADMMLREVRNG